MKKELKIAVIGAGAIGGTTAALMTKAGYDVEMVCKHQSIAEKVKVGLKLVGVMGEHAIKMQAVKEIDELTGIKDYIFVATKAYDMPESCKKALKFADENTLFISMQNGISIDAMAEVVGEERTVGCVVGYGGTMLEHGVLDITSTGEFVIGMKKNIDKLEELKHVMDSAFKTTISPNIYEELYSKLIVNSCITSLGAISGIYLGQMLKQKHVRDIFLKIMAEAVDVANAMGLNLPLYAGKLDYYKLVDLGSSLKRFKAHLTIRVVGIKYRRLKSSSLQSLERGRKTEIDFFNGYIAKKADEMNVAAPINKAITEIIKEIEDKKRKIDVSNFYDKKILSALK
ncbi:MAG: 2-dehydropantoate 2-reductase [Eubacteriales bacterium]